MAFNFDYRAVAYVLAAGESRDFQALRFLALAAATSAIEIAPKGKAGTFGTFQLKQIIEDPDGAELGPVTVRNPTGGAVTITLLTSNKRMVFSPTSSAQSVTIDGVSVTIPVSIAANVAVVGPAAHGAAVAGAPVEMAGEARDSERAAIAVAQASRLITDLVGKLIVLPYTNPETIENGKSAACAGAGGSANILAAVAGLRHYVTDLLIDNPTATATQWQVLDGATVIASGEVAANGQAVVNFSVPLRGTAATALVIKQTAAAGLIGYSSGFKGT